MRSGEMRELQPVIMPDGDNSSADVVSGTAGTKSKSN